MDQIMLLPVPKPKQKKANTAGPNKPTQSAGSRTPQHATFSTASGESAESKTPTQFTFDAASTQSTGSRTPTQATFSAAATQATDSKRPTHAAESKASAEFMDDKKQTWTREEQDAEMPDWARRKIKARVEEELRRKYVLKWAKGQLRAPMSPQIQDLQLQFLVKYVDDPKKAVPEEYVKPIYNLPITIDFIRKAVRYAHDMLASVICAVWELDLEIANWNDLQEHTPEERRVVLEQREHIRYQLEDAFMEPKRKPKPSECPPGDPLGETLPHDPNNPWINAMPRGQHVGDETWLMAEEDIRILIKEAHDCAAERDIMEKVEENLRMMCIRHEAFKAGSTWVVETEEDWKAKQSATKVRRGRNGIGDGRGRGGRDARGRGRGQLALTDGREGRGQLLLMDGSSEQQVALTEGRVDHQTAMRDLRGGTAIPMRGGRGGNDIAIRGGRGGTISKTPHVGNRGAGMTPGTFYGEYGAGEATPQPHLLPGGGIEVAPRAGSGEFNRGDSGFGRGRRAFRGWR